MKQSARLIQNVAGLLLVLPALVATAPMARGPFTRVEKLRATEEHALFGLRGTPPKWPSASNDIFLQGSGTLLQRSSKIQQHMTQGLKQMLQMNLQKRSSQRRKQAHKVGICKRNKMRWWIKIKKTCIKAFGKDSRWDNEKSDGKCSKAWSECNTFMYAICCSQPVGPKNMKAYCANQAMANAVGDQKDVKNDKACQVQNKMRSVRDSMGQIKDTIGLLSVDTSNIYLLGPGPAPAPAPAIPVPPAGLLASDASAPAPAPMPTQTPNGLADRCAKLTELTRQAAAKIQAIKLWAKQDGIKEKRDGVEELKEGTDHESAEAKDPDLVFSVKGVIHAGEKLDAMLKNPGFCSSGDYDEDDSEEDTTDDGDDDDNGIVAINDTAILDLLNWDTDMKNAVDKFEKEVHPHGFKWWRYRYEYTLVESLVLASSVIVMYLVMWLLHGISFFHSNRFYKTGKSSGLYRYAWAYLMFHAASLMVMVTTAYMLYIPWGKQNIFNWFAGAVHFFVDGRANVPFLGYSWMHMVLDVQFQLFVCFALYSLFIVFVAHNSQRALEDWKALGDDAEYTGATASNAHLFKTLTRTMQTRVQNTPEYRQIFHGLKLSLPGVSGLEKLDRWSEFKLHLYLTDGLGQAIEYLVQVSLTTTIFLACSSLLVAVLAHHFQVAFMYFLPGFLALGLVLFIAGYFVTRHFRALSDNDDHNTPAKYVTVRSYCRAIQIMLYCVLFSFSRLLLSNDIFSFYPHVYISAVMGLLVVLAVLAFIAGEMIKETTCALILPPHVPQDQFEKKLQQVVYWHTTEVCHECGVQQHPADSSYSREWAGKGPRAERKEGPPDSARPYSWRG